MPALPNPRHERYAQEFFKGLSNGITQEEAYRAAGYLPSNTNPRPHPMRRLQIQLLVGFGGNEAGRRPLHSLGHGMSVSERPRLQAQ
jgi:hypothetical protein